MATPLKVLIVEDRASDAELMVYELERSGFQPRWTRAETEPEYLAQLQTFPDIILADHTLPEFGASQALETLKQSGLDIPFIVVTGSISEEVAVDRLKQGAADYILKDRMARLGDAVTRALREKKLRDEKCQADQEIQRNLERIRALHEIDLAITSTLELDTILKVLLEKIELFLPIAAATTVRLLNRESREMESLACRGMNEEEWRSQERRVLTGRAKRVVETKAPFTVLNVQTFPGTRDPEFYRKQELASYLGVPLIARDEVIGVLGLYTKEEHEFTNEEIEFLNTLAGQGAIAIHNAQLFEQTRKQAEELEKANRVKDEFLSVMSHELRTPLSVVMGYTGMIKEGMLGEINPKQEDALQKVLNRAADQLNLINGIMQTTQLEARAIVPDPHLVNLSEFLAQLKSDYELTHDKNEVELIWDYPVEPVPIVTDSGKLKQILQNLIDNAVKFTDGGAVTVSMRVVAEKKRKKWVELKVADTGAGIAQEQISRVFEKFYQIDSSETRLYGGVGLGLYIARKFTELLGGTIGVESEPGKGSTFTVRLPHKD